MPARLLPLTSGSAPTIAVQRPVLLVGRHPDCDVRIDLSKVSRRHCCIALAYERIMIRDLGSRNGTRVNGRIVDEAQLHAGDEVAIGPLIYRVEDAGTPARRTGAPGSKAVAGPTSSPVPSPPSLPSLPVQTGEHDSDLIPLDF